MLWAAAKALPAATFPIVACKAAAAVPNGHEGLDATSRAGQRGRELTGGNPSGAKAQQPHGDGGYDRCQDNSRNSSSGCGNDLKQIDYVHECIEHK